MEPQPPQRHAENIQGGEKNPGHQGVPVTVGEKHWSPYNTTEIHSKWGRAQCIGSEGQYISTIWDRAYRLTHKLRLVQEKILNFQHP